MQSELRVTIVLIQQDLPPGVFLSPELSGDAPAALRRSLARMMLHGHIEVQGGRVGPGPAKRDPRFPNVEDMISYQAAQFRETREALERAAVGVVVEPMQP